MHGKYFMVIKGFLQHVFDLLGIFHQSAVIDGVILAGRSKVQVQVGFIFVYVVEVGQMGVKLGNDLLIAVYRPATLCGREPYDIRHGVAEDGKKSAVVTIQIGNVGRPPHLIYPKLHAAAAGRRIGEQVIVIQLKYPLEIAVHGTVPIGKTYLPIRIGRRDFITPGDGVRSDWERLCRHRIKMGGYNTAVLVIVPGD